MFTGGQYQLLDFGGGRRLERFGQIVVDRPCPAAEGIERADPDAWQQADARFQRGEGDQGQWVCRRPLPEAWMVSYELPSPPAPLPKGEGSSSSPPAPLPPGERGVVVEASLRFALRCTPAGQVGLFPEQAESWQWIAAQASPLPLGEGWGEGISEGRPSPHPHPLSQRERGAIAHPQPLSQRERGAVARPLHVLNLFAYTGGSTLAAAAAGAQVVHVDAAENIVAWARRNAELSGLDGSPIRWIAEDALKFVKRELRRGARYDAVILDPPSYGHGRRGEVWRLSKQLPRLLALCGQLTAGRLRFMLLTCHTPGFGPPRAADMMTAALGQSDRGTVVAGELTLPAASGRTLPCGVAARWQADVPSAAKH